MRTESLVAGVGGRWKEWVRERGRGWGEVGVVGEEDGGGEGDYRRRMGAIFVVMSGDSGEGGGCVCSVQR